MNVLGLVFLMLNFILGISARRLYMFTSENASRLPREQLQNLVASHMNQQQVPFPHADQVRKQIFSRKFWKR